MRRPTGFRGSQRERESPDQLVWKGCTSKERHLGRALTFGLNLPATSRRRDKRSLRRTASSNTWLCAENGGEPDSKGDTGHSVKFE